MITTGLNGRSGNARRWTRLISLLCYILLLGGCVRFQFTRFSHVKLAPATEGYIHSVGRISEVYKGLYPAGTLCVEAMGLNYPSRRKIHLERRAALQGCKLLGPILSTDNTTSCATCYSESL